MTNLSHGPPYEVDEDFGNSHDIKTRVTIHSGQNEAYNVNESDETKGLASVAFPESGDCERCSLRTHKATFKLFIKNPPDALWNPDTKEHAAEWPWDVKKLPPPYQEAGL